MEETEGIVLRSFDFRQTSRIVTFFTRHFGKIKGLAKGARRMNSPFGSSLEPFSYDYICFYKSRCGNIHLLSKCEVKNFFPEIREDTLKSAIALYWVEIIHELAEDRDEGLFEFLLSSLAFLDSERELPSLLVSFFELNLLKLSGYGPVLTHCVNCKKERDTVKFSSKFGGLLCLDCYFKDERLIDISPNTISLMRLLMRIPVEHISRIRVTSKLLGQLKGVIHYYLFYSIGKRPKSLSFLEKVKKEKEGVRL